MLPVTVAPRFKTICDGSIPPPRFTSAAARSKLYNALTTGPGKPFTTAIARTHCETLIDTGAALSGEEVDGIEPS